MIYDYLICFKIANHLLVAQFNTHGENDGFDSYMYTNK